ncbi:MAG: cation transporter [Bacteroidales bacterium]|nr:cation transporter [Bacteroidales bacterium]MCF8454841.1 cation transporter [Bacteroidales bacterium]
MKGFANDVNFKANFQKSEIKTDTVKVWGNCEMCKKTIEKAANSVEGVSKAKWSVKKKILTVSYNADATSLDAIEKKVASVGYDTRNYTAEKKVYDNLHSCCQYDRPERK